MTYLEIFFRLLDDLAYAFYYSFLIAYDIIYYIPSYIYFFITCNFVNLIKVLIIVIPLLIAVAYFTLAERKLLAAVQRRNGPNVVGVFGLLQPLTDGAKLLLKEVIHPAAGHRIIFLLAPMLTFILCFVSYSLIPFDKYAAYTEINVGAIIILTVSSFSVLSIILAGWSSNSKYGFLGALRSTAQFISYELAMGFMILPVVLLSGSFSLYEIVDMQDDTWFFVTLSPLAIIFFSCILAETNRHPFDLPEAETELVSGFNTEYSGMSFALFSLGEYANMLIMACLHTILFFGAWHPLSIFLAFIPGSIWFSLKVSIFVGLFTWARSGLPRYRYDHLMGLGWKVFLPISIGYVFFTAFMCTVLNITF